MDQHLWQPLFAIISEHMSLRREPVVKSWNKNWIDSNNLNFRDSNGHCIVCIECDQVKNGIQFYQPQDINSFTSCVVHGSPRNDSCFVVIKIDRKFYLYLFNHHHSQTGKSCCQWRMPSAANAKSEKPASSEAMDNSPIRQIMTIIEHKIRNLEKRKVRTLCISQHLYTDYN